jgi:transposase-like protein
VIVLAVRWYLRFGLSYRDIEELLAERGIQVDHVSVYRWVQRFTPLLAEAARPCRHQVGDCWYTDETYVKVAGRWRYLYRAIDQFGQVIDLFVSMRRDATAARRFFEHAIGTTNATPMEVVTDLAPVGTVASGRRASPASSKWRRPQPRGLQEVLKTINRGCRRRHSGALWRTPKAVIARRNSALTPMAILDNNVHESYS